MILGYGKDNIIATDQVPNGITMTAAYYQKFTYSVLCPQIQKLRPRKIDSGMSILHNDARPHAAQPVFNLFIDYAWETLRNPTYSTILSPLHLSHFPKLKERLTFPIPIT